MTEPLKPQWVVVDRQVLAALLENATRLQRFRGRYDSETTFALRRLTRDVEQGRCTLLTQARWNGEGE